MKQLIPPPPKSGSICAARTNTEHFVIKHSEPVFTLGKTFQVGVAAAAAISGRFCLPQANERTGTTESRDINYRITASALASMFVPQLPRSPTYPTLSMEHLLRAKLAVGCCGSCLFGFICATTSSTTAADVGKQNQCFEFNATRLRSLDGTLNENGKWPSLGGARSWRMGNKRDIPYG